MDRGAWRATVHGGHKKSDMPEHTYTLLIGPGNYRAHLKPHSKVTSREKERERAHASRVLL